MAIIACTNTTSNLMTQLFLELAAHPSILNRIALPLQSVLEQHMRHESPLKFILTYRCPPSSLNMEEEAGRS
ncbi:hypothetical protein NA56DRAFT_712289 [Hyaloscypha hepaticicola]|uniref:Cytochrome P450 n=1 Tax=Hyaloscypha hepaticicola TaxID=2082293 RepID=A0A2J6PGS7_9HELO|nr:hypothetical protein NA56DRAFT_712289 [Hyaloscypha hepaticicola]